VIDDNALIEKWEPKVQRLLRTSYVAGLDRDDLAQELRIAIVKAARGYKNEKGAGFHTFLHTVMTNHIRTLITKAQRQLHPGSLDIVSDENMQPEEIMKALEVFDPAMIDLEIEEALGSDLTTAEKDYLVLRIEGMTMDEITDDIGESSYTVRNSLRKKMSLGEQY